MAVNIDTRILKSVVKKDQYCTTKSRKFDHSWVARHVSVNTLNPLPGLPPPRFASLPLRRVSKTAPSCDLATCSAKTRFTPSSSKAATRRPVTVLARSQGQAAGPVVARAAAWAAAAVVGAAVVGAAEAAAVGVEEAEVGVRVASNGTTATVPR